MSKVTLNSVTSGFASIQTLNNNFTTIQTEFDNTLSRDGSTPNAMAAPLDMGGNKIINCGSPSDLTDLVRLKDLALTSFTNTTLPSQNSKGGSVLSTDGTSQFWDNTSRCFRNKVMNGGFDLWQRTTSLASGTGSRYMADRWCTLSNTSTYTGSQQSFTPGQTAVPGEPSYFHRITTTPTVGVNNYTLLRHSIEDVHVLAGKTAVLSFWAKGTGGGAMGVELSQYFGIGGSSGVYINPTLVNLTTTWTLYTIVFNIPSISGQTLGDNTRCLQVDFWFEAGATYAVRSAGCGQVSGTYDIWGVQLEEGTVPTVFETLPTVLIRSMCERYYEASSSPGDIWSNATTNGQGYYKWVPYKVDKRSGSTVTLTAVGGLTGFATVGTVDTSTTTSGFRIFNTSNATQSESHYQFSFTADADY